MQGKIFFLFEYPKNLKKIFKCIHTVYENTVLDLDTVYSVYRALFSNHWRWMLVLGQVT